MTLRLPVWWPKGLLVLVALVAWHWYGAEQRHRGEADQRIKAREVTIAALAKQHRTDTLRLVTTRHITDSVLSTDTVWSTDTVVKLIRAERVACDALVGTCEAEKAQLRAQIVDLKKLKPSRFGCVAGGTASTNGAGIGVACGVRLTK